VGGVLSGQTASFLAADTCSHARTLQLARAMRAVDGARLSLLLLMALSASMILVRDVGRPSRAASAFLRIARTRVQRLRGTPPVGPAGRAGNESGSRGVGADAPVQGGRRGTGDGDGARAGAETNASAALRDASSAAQAAAGRGASGRGGTRGSLDAFDAASGGGPARGGQEASAAGPQQHTTAEDSHAQAAADVLPPLTAAQLESMSASEGALNLGDREYMLRRAPPARMTDYSRGHPILAMPDARLQDTSASQLLEMYSEIYDRPPFCNDICQRDFGFALVRRWRSVKARWCQPAGMPVSVGLFGLYLYIYIYVYYLGLFCQEKVSFAPRVPLELCHIVAVPARRYANLNTPLWPYE